MFHLPLLAALLVLFSGTVLVSCRPVENVAKTYEKSPMPPVSVPLGKTLYLCPKKAGDQLSVLTSKMGGQPNIAALKQWPRCDVCGKDMNFILQLYRAEFPQFTFPEDTDLFLLFRCPNPDCKDAYAEAHDRRLQWYYVASGNKNAGAQHFAQHLLRGEDVELPIPECTLEPILKTDNENYSDAKPQNWYGTKIGGYPSWTQNHLTVTCHQCNKPKSFFFQLATQAGHRWTYETEFEDHGIQIGDVGNIYFFICYECGARSIETVWDCE